MCIRMAEVIIWTAELVFPTHNIGTFQLFKLNGGTFPCSYLSVFASSHSKLLWFGTVW